MVPSVTEYTEVQWIDGSHLQSLDSKSSHNVARPRFLAYGREADKIFGEAPTLSVALQAREPLFHEAAVFVPGDSNDLLFTTSNILVGPDGSRQIKVSKLSRPREGKYWTHQDVPVEGVPMANGGINMPGNNSILICSQGNETFPSSLVSLSVHEPSETEIILSNFHGRKFNSLNDVIIARDGSIWFTDPVYGHEQGFRPQPELPNQVYRYDPRTKIVRAVADGFGRPNGLCFSPDEQTLYVTDTDWIHGDGTTDGNRVSHIYAFTVMTINGGTFLTNRRLFAMADCGAPDGIKCDTDGRVYSGCGDGVNIWSASGDLVAKIVIPGGVANFCFGRPGELLMMNESMLWIANLAKGLRGALLENLDIQV